MVEDARHIGDPLAVVIPEPLHCRTPSRISSSIMNP
jgi:hypothetical protein